MNTASTPHEMESTLNVPEYPFDESLLEFLEDIMGSHGTGKWLRCDSPYLSDRGSLPFGEDHTRAREPATEVKSTGQHEAGSASAWRPEILPQSGGGSSSWDNTVVKDEVIVGPVHGPPPGYFHVIPPQETLSAASSSKSEDPVHRKKCGTCHRYKTLEDFNGKATCMLCLDRKKQRQGQAREAVKVETERLTSDSLEAAAILDTARLKNAELKSEHDRHEQACITRGIKTEKFRAPDIQPVEAQEVSTDATDAIKKKRTRRRPSEARSESSSDASAPPPACIKCSTCRHYLEPECYHGKNRTCETCLQKKKRKADEKSKQPELLRSKLEELQRCLANVLAENTALEKANAHMAALLYDTGGSHDSGDTESATEGSGKGNGNGMLQARLSGSSLSSPRNRRSWSRSSQQETRISILPEPASPPWHLVKDTGIKSPRTRVIASGSPPPTGRRRSTEDYGTPFSPPLTLKRPSSFNSGNSKEEAHVVSLFSVEAKNGSRRRLSKDLMTETHQEEPSEPSILMLFFLFLRFSLESLNFRFRWLMYFMAYLLILSAIPLFIVGLNRLDTPAMRPQSSTPMIN